MKPVNEIIPVISERQNEEILSTGTLEQRKWQ